MCGSSNLPLVCLSLLIGLIQYFLRLRRRTSSTARNVSITTLSKLTSDKVFILNLLTAFWGLTEVFQTQCGHPTEVFHQQEKRDRVFQRVF